MFTRVFAAFVFFCAASSIRAEIIVTFDSTSITANQAGFVDVFVESTGTDILTGFDAYFQLMAPLAVNGTLSFSPTVSQPNSQTLFGAGYVLSGHPGLDPINFGTELISDTEIRVKDFLNFVPIEGNEKPLGTTKWRLARFALIHSTSNATLSHGDTFEIKMFPKKRDLTEDTVFFDSSSDLTIAAISFANSGSIRVTAGATAVPEPSVMLASAMGLLVFGAKRLRRKIRNQSVSS